MVIYLVKAFTNITLYDPVYSVPASLKLLQGCVTAMVSAKTVAMQTESWRVFAIIDSF
jgi:hypothetical protein